MTKIAYLLLCHKDPKGIAALAETLTSCGDSLTIHFDARAPRSVWQQLKTLTAPNPSVSLVEDRVKCGWGEWSLVSATLKALRLAFERNPDATHFYLVSGDCRPIKTAEYTHRWLEQRDVDYIESFDFFESGWIKTGIRRDRLVYRHYINERKYKRLFYTSLNLQRRLGLERPIPDDLEMMIGSQWWCLRQESVRRILEFCDSRPDVMRFFATTWIPDETFFQTLIRSVVPAREIISESPTFKMFTDYGLPQIFHNDHRDLLLSQSKIFARKISPEATELATELEELYPRTGVQFQTADDGLRLFSYLTSRGRVGRRFAPRFWENDASFGQDRELILVLCKKWHVAKRLIATAEREAGMPMLGYFFNEHHAGQPDLGGVDSTVQKRHRHRRLMIRMIFDIFEVPRMGICIDPGQLDLVDDFMSDRGDVSILQIDCDFSEAYLEGHAQRLGLINDESPRETLLQIVPGLRADLEEEREKLRERRYGRHMRIAEWYTPEHNANVLARLFDIDQDRARNIAETPHLFAD